MASLGYNGFFGDIIAFRGYNGFFGDIMASLG
jgi:hypothetical protein